MNEHKGLICACDSCKEFKSGLNAVHKGYYEPSKMSEQERHKEIVFEVNSYRDLDGNDSVQVTATCKCGRGGFVRIPRKEM